MKTIHVEIGVGELADRITILELKRRHAHSKQQRGRVDRELARLRLARAQAGLALPALEREIETLRAINRRLWEVEDQIRACERRRDFGRRFVELARTIYKHNDRRSLVKRQIDVHHESGVRDEKIYATVAGNKRRTQFSRRQRVPNESGG